MDVLDVVGVELGSVGIAWPTSTGPRTVTFEHLVDIVAADNDPLIRAGRVKLGHEPWQLHPDGGTCELGDYDPFWTGEPALGSIRNLRLNDEGAKLLGDFTDVPAWLVDAMPTAWPNRSVELVHDVETEAGHRYSRVLTACALLGVRQQAIKDLADVRRVLDGDPELVEFSEL